MTVQSRQSVSDLLLHIQGASAPAAPKGEIPFQDLLDGALQSTSQPPKAQDTKPEQPVAKEQPKQEAKPQEPVSEAPKDAAPQKPQKPQETDETAQAMAAAAAVAPVVIAPEPVEIQEALPQMQTAPLILMPQAQPAEQVSMPQTAVQTAPVQAIPQAEPAAQSQPQQVEILSAELHVEPAEQTELAPVAQAIPTEVPVPPKDEAQQRFDTLIAKASQELEAAKVPQQQVAQQSQPEVEEAKAPAQEPPIQAQAPAKEPVVRLAKPEQEVPKAELIEAEQPQAQSIREARVEETQAPQQPQATTPAQQIEAQVIKNLEDQKMEFRMQLAPKELGKVDVRMLVEGGKLTVQIAAASKEAVQELQKTSEGLISSLRLASLQLESVQIVHQPHQASEHMDGAFQMANGHSNQSGGQRQEGGGTGVSTAEGEENLPAESEPERLLDETA